MKGVFSAPGDFVYFKSQVPLHKIPIGTKQWRYYDFGPKVVPPLICLPGTAGTAEVYYKQIMSLSMKGYRVIAVDIPRVWNHQEWIQAFEKFLDAIDVHHRHPWEEKMLKPFVGSVYGNVLKIHLYGTSLGGFLAQLFAQHRPRRVRSLVLSNTFLDTRSFAAAMPWATMYVVMLLHIDCKLDIINVSWTPSFLLKRYVLTGIHDGPHEPFIADSVDFVVSQVETLSREDLASRLTLTADAASVQSLLLSDSHVTIMDEIGNSVNHLSFASVYNALVLSSDEVHAYLLRGRNQTNDYCATPQQLKDQLNERYPGARRASLKTGGDFPFLSRPDEVNLHLQLHLRRVGLEARPDLVPGIPKDGPGGNPSEKKNEKEDPNNPPKDDGGNSENPSTESQLPEAPESSESHNEKEDLDNPLKVDGGNSENPSTESQLAAAPESSESHNEKEDLDNPLKVDGGNSENSSTESQLPTSYGEFRIS
ncbi:hypothetical protein JRO89_XS13G0049300 [Xanthoceras sorbifolium]|uniref:Maspardin n=1 Tax=Xanthoceras sorbifolium TaxID=99658 RepID=A0ABQ8H6M4_9ROSI|nr:hypothetical protein JRO89_XS13G0049300 [Xanthoceras sorbifolium]